MSTEATAVLTDRDAMCSARAAVEAGDELTVEDTSDFDSTTLWVW